MHIAHREKLKEKKRSYGHRRVQLLTAVFVCDPHSLGRQSMMTTMMETKEDVLQSRKCNARLLL